MCVMGFVLRQGIALILTQVCDTAGLLFDVNLWVPHHSMTQNLGYLRNVSATKVLQSNNFVELSCTICRFKRYLKKRLHDDSIEVKEVNIQLSFVRYKRKLVLRFKVRQYISGCVFGNVVR